MTLEASVLLCLTPHRSLHPPYHFFPQSITFEMRILTVLHLVPLLLSLVGIATCRLALPNIFRQTPKRASSLIPPSTYDNAQAPIMPVIPSNDPDATNPDTITHTPTLLDTLPLTRRINIFSSLLRDHPDLPSILSPPSNHKKDQQPANFTILAPLNSALQSLTHKPWEDSSDYATFGERAYDGQGGQERAKGNLKKFVEAHVLPKSPWAQGEKVQTLAGKEVWWEEKSEKKRFIMPDEVEVDDVVSRAANGEVWVLKGALKF
jgi:Fasciclin domain